MTGATIWTSFAQLLLLFLNFMSSDLSEGGAKKNCFSENPGNAVILIAVIAANHFHFLSHDLQFVVHSCKRGMKVRCCDIWDTDYNTDNWEPEFMTIFVTWQLIVTLDSIRNSCDVFLISSMNADKILDFCGNSE